MQGPQRLHPGSALFRPSGNCPLRRFKRERIIMIKTMLSLLSAGVLFALAPMASASFDPPEPVYWYLYFSDASMTEQVGSLQEVCTSWGVMENALQGQRTAYSSQILLGYCDNGVLIML